MRYYTIRIQTKLDDTEVRTIIPYDNRDDAEIQYHKCLATDMSSSEIKSVLCLVLNEVGYVEMSRRWIKEIVEPAQEETESIDSVEEEN